MCYCQLRMRVKECLAIKLHNKYFAVFLSMGKQTFISKLGLICHAQISAPIIKPLWKLFNLANHGL